MRNWRDLVVDSFATVREALSRIDSGTAQLALVLDDQGSFVGIITDGDVRRGLLKGITLDDPLSLVMNPRPITGVVGRTREDGLGLMRAKGVRHLPILDTDGRLVGLQITDELSNSDTFDNPVVLMAGGLGTRLRPLTNHLPKPMLPIGGRPILEHLVNSLSSQGFRRIYISVRYLAEIVEEHFGDGARFGVEIDYLKEDETLGTAGALSLLPADTSKPIIVINGDLITDINISQMLDFHTGQGAYATMAVSSHQYQVPYGVVQTSGARVSSVVEKPLVSWFVNAGAYVLEPQILQRVEAETYLDMPDLLNAVIQAGFPISAFPLREAWRDIGRLLDLQLANRELDGPEVD